MDGVTDLEGDPDELLELAVKSGTHSEKMTAMLALETIIPMLAGVQADALGTVFKRATGREANDLKQRSLYTDFVAGGHPREPSLVLEDEWAQELRTAICKSVVVWSILLPQVAEQTVTEGARETDARSSPA
jgi:AbiV family abortive infection protein